MKGLQTEFAKHVLTSSERTMTALKGLYFQVTAWLPRRLPMNETEFDLMKYRFIQYFGLLDDPNTWMTVGGQITSTKPTSIRKSYGAMVNAAKRHMYVNPVAHHQKILAGKELERRIRALQEQVDAKEKEGRTTLQGGSPDLQRGLQAVPSIEEGVVPGAHEQV